MCWLACILQPVWRGPAARHRRRRTSSPLRHVPSSRSARPLRTPLRLTMRAWCFSVLGAVARAVVLPPCLPLWRAGKLCGCPYASPARRWAPWCSASFLTISTACRSPCRWARVCSVPSVRIGALRLCCLVTPLSSLPVLATRWLVHPPPRRRGGPSWLWLPPRCGFWGGPPGAPWDLSARPAAGAVYGTALGDARVVADRAGPVVTDPTSQGWVGASAGCSAGAVLTAVAAALTWLAARPPAPTLIRIGDDTAAMVVAGIVDPSCVRRPGEGPLSPAHGVARLAVLVRRLWSSECERRGGRLYLLSTLPDEGRPWAERPCALAFYGRRGAVGFVPQPWPNVAPAPPLTDDRTAPAVEDTCAVCLAPYSDILPSPDPDSRAPPGRWGVGGVRCPHAICRECDASLQEARARCPICRNARCERVLLP